MNQALYTALAFLAGVAVPVMATLNAGLGARFGSPFAAAAVLCIVALMVCLAGLWASGAMATLRWPGLSLGFTAGILFSVYIVSITWLAPRLGLGNAIFLVLLGQLVTAAIIDHFGLLGAPRVPVEPKRLAGLAIMAVGVYLARKPL